MPMDYVDDIDDTNNTDEDMKWYGVCAFMYVDVLEYSAAWYGSDINAKGHLVEGAYWQIERFIHNW